MTRYDKILIVAVFLFSILGLYISKNTLLESGSKYLYIEVDGEEYREITFDDSTQMSLDIDTDLGHNEISIESGVVNMSDADCRDKLCVQEPPIDKVGDIIVCLPNRVLLEIRGSDSREVDYISH